MSTAPKMKPAKGASIPQSAATDVHGESQTRPADLDARATRNAKAERARYALEAAGFSIAPDNVELGQNLFIACKYPMSRSALGSGEQASQSNSEERLQRVAAHGRHSIERARRSLKKAGLKIKPFLLGGQVWISFRDDPSHGSHSPGEAALQPIEERRSFTGKQVSPGILRFVQRGGHLVTEQCGDTETCIANTYRRLFPYMGEAKTIVRSRGGKITANDLQRNFKNTDFVKALDTDDWNTLIDEFRKKRPAGCRNLMIGLLARRTGKSIATVDKYTKPSRNRQKAPNQ